MADDKQAKKAAIDDLKKLKPMLKDLSPKVSELAKLNEQNFKALDRLQSSIDGLKPRPAKTAALGDLKTLEKEVRLVQSSVRFEVFRSSRDELGNALSSKGASRVMLRGLISFAGTNHAQHTGGTSGEAYNRRGNREVLLALKGLHAGDAQLDHAAKTVEAIGRKPPKISAKTTVSELKDMIDDVVSDRKSLAELQRDVDSVAGDLMEGADQLADAFSDDASGPAA